MGHSRSGGDAPAALELFACFLGPPEAIARALRRGKLMIESPMYDYVRKLARDEARAEARAEALAEARAEARAEAQLETMATAVVEALTVRFGHVPPEVAEGVAAVTDADRLGELHRLAIVTDSIEQFAQALPQSQPH